MRNFTPDARCPKFYSSRLVLGQIFGTFCPILDSCKNAIFGWLVSLASYISIHTPRSAPKRSAGLPFPRAYFGFLLLLTPRQLNAHPTSSVAKVEGGIWGRLWGISEYHGIKKTLHYVILYTILIYIYIYSYISISMVQPCNPPPPVQVGAV